MARQPTLNQGAERLSGVVREVRERQRTTSGVDTLSGPAQDPAEAWARKYNSEGFGPDARGSTTSVPEPHSAHRQAQFMAELKAKMGEGHGKHAQSYGKLAMQKPFSPKNQPKKSIWSRMTRGS